MAVTRQVDFSSMAVDCVQALVNKRSGRPSVCGWLCLVLLLVVLSNLIFRKDAPSGLNPKFKDADFQLPAAPHHENVEFLNMDDVVGEKKGQNKKSGIVKVPIFDPNREKKKMSRQDQAGLHKYGMPRPKEFPVTILEEPRLTCDGDLLLFMLVHTAPEQQVARNASRHSWGRQEHTRHEFDGDGQKWMTVYVMGKPREQSRAGISISEENAKYGDILQGDFYDTPFEDTRKFMLGMTWLVDYIQSGNRHNNRNAAQCMPRFVLKTKSIIFHNMPSIIGWLENKFKDKEVAELYMGHILRRDVPIRDPYDPMYVSPDDYLPAVFPDMIREPVYLFSYDTFVAMHAMVTIVTPIAMEDAYVSLLADNVGVKPRDNDHFHMLRLSRNLCHIVNNFFFYDVMAMEHIRLAEQIRACRQEQLEKKLPRAVEKPPRENL